MPLPENPRAIWMSELAQASWADLQEFSNTINDWPSYELIHAPERGAIMLRGRISGQGAAFPLGECSVVRCTLCDAMGYSGVAYVMGGQEEHALWAARWDALLQNPAGRDHLWNTVILVLRTRRLAREGQRANKTTATQVQFFSMESMRT